MENMVATDAINETEVNGMRDDGDAGVDEISLSDLVQPDESDSKTVEHSEADAPKDEQPSDDGSKDQIKNQKSFDDALKNRLEYERKRLEKLPQYRLGKMLLEERMRAENVDAEKAFALITKEHDSAKAQEYAKNPQSFFEDYLNSQRQSAPEPQAAENEAEALAKQMIEAQNAGMIPASFNPKVDITPDFLRSLQQYGAPAAFAIWDAKRQVAEQAEIERQKSAPKPMPVSGSTKTHKKLDFSSMSSKEFWDLENKIQEAKRSGKKVTF